MSLRKIIILGSVLIIVASGVLLMNYFTGFKKEPPQNQSKEAKRYVETTKIEYQDINSGVFASGRLVTCPINFSKITGNNMCQYI